MNKMTLKERAAKLEELLIKYAPIDEDACSLHRGLEKFLVGAKNLEFDEFIARDLVPGVYLFDETNLQAHRDLTEAYFLFRSELCGQIILPS
jgi:hypothetical protein